MLEGRTGRVLEWSAKGERGYGTLSGLWKPWSAVHGFSRRTGMEDDAGEEREGRTRVWMGSTRGDGVGGMMRRARSKERNDNEQWEEAQESETEADGRSLDKTGEPSLLGGLWDSQD